MPGASTPAAPAGGLIAGASPDIANWYRSVYGRDPDKGGVDFWNGQLQQIGNVDDTFKAFTAGGYAHNEKYIGTGLTAAQASVYKGPTSGDGRSALDEWSRNVLGADGLISNEDRARYQAALDAASLSGDSAASDAVYKQFTNDYKGRVVRNLSSVEASQLQGYTNIQAPYLAKPEAPTPEKYNSIQAHLNPETDTVEGRVNALMTSGNPLLDRASHLADQRSNERGLINSSIGTQAGQAAVLDAAMQMATPDAAAYNTQRLTNQGYDNDAAKYNANEVNTIKKMGYSNDLTQSNMTLGNYFDMNKLDKQSQNQLTQLQHQADITHDATSYNAALNAAAAFSAEVNRINSDDKLDYSIKPGLIQAAEDNFNRQLAYYAALGNTSHGTLLDTTTIPGHATAVEGVDYRYDGSPVQQEIYASQSGNLTQAEDFNFQQQYQQGNFQDINIEIGNIDPWV